MRLLSFFVAYLFFVTVLLAKHNGVAISNVFGLDQNEELPRYLFTSKNACMNVEPMEPWTVRCTDRRLVFGAAWAKGPC